jgi:hypothetical protein
VAGLLLLASVSLWSVFFSKQTEIMSGQARLQEQLEAARSLRQKRQYDASLKAYDQAVELLAR